MKEIINKIENLIQGTEPSTLLYMSMDSDAWTEVLVTLKEYEEMKNYVEKLRELRAESPRAFVQLLRRGQVG